MTDQNEKPPDGWPEGCLCAPHFSGEKNVRLWSADCPVHQPGSADHKLGRMKRLYDDGGDVSEP